MDTITVSTKNRNYEVLIGESLLDNIGNLIIDRIDGIEKILILTDDNVSKYYLDRIVSNLSNLGYKVNTLILKHGEASKSFDNLILIINELAGLNMTRSDALISLGGGVIGDIGALAASLFLRGIKLISIPTTLLSCVDSSVGGKTAINIKAGKNLMGSFYQPHLVIFSADTLDTLPRNEFINGMAEVIKYGFIRNKEILNILSKTNIDEIIKDKGLITKLSFLCISIKRDIVMVDELDKGERQLLNFGHSLGHAIERISDFEISHGEAVAIGMSLITKASCKKGLSNKETYDTLISLLDKYELPNNTTYPINELFNYILNDKKRNGKNINLIITISLGEAKIVSMTIDECKDLLELAYDNN